MANKLKLNDSKTECMLISSKHARKQPNIETVTIGGMSVSTVTSARNIGAIVDGHLTMVEHIASISTCAYSHLQNNSKIIKYLTKEATATLINSLITSRLDNLNSLLTGLPDVLIIKLQKIQNHAAKLVTKKRKCEHVTPIQMNKDEWGGDK